MIEHAIYYDPKTKRMCLFHKTLKILIVTKSAIHQLIIFCVVSMRRRLKKRSDVHRITAKSRDVRKPFLQLHKPVYHSLLFIFKRCTAQSKRIHMIKYCVVVPFTHYCKLSCFLFYFQDKSLSLNSDFYDFHLCRRSKRILPICFYSLSV